MKTCTICESNATDKILDWKQFDIMKCKNCKLIFAHPLPSDEELAAYYQGFMFNKPEEYEITKTLEKKTKELKRLFDLVNMSTSPRKKKLLDFGGGTGVAYKAATDLGLEAYYQDLDKEAEAFSKSVFGLSSEYIIEDIRESDMKFDYIISDNVIEHVQDPIGFVDVLVNQLEKGGTVVIKTPHAANTETFFNPFIALKRYFRSALKYNSLSKSISAYFKKFWHCDPPRHLYSFSETSLHSLVKKLKCQSLNHEVQYYKIPTFGNTLTRLFFTRDKHLTLIKSVVLRLIIWPIIPIETCLQILKFILLKLGMISPGGIILKITKT